MKPILRLCILFPSLCAFAYAAEQPALKICKVDEVRIGMKGVGKTVMQGTQVQEFQAEVIGILRKVFPNQDLIIAKLSGLNLEKTGVISGMSGSPVYVDGKLLGAVSYGWAFSKEPICGITPAEQMCTLISDGEPPQGAAEGALAPAAPGWWAGPAARAAAARGRSHSMAPVSIGAAGSIALTRLRAPLVVSGCPQAVFSRFSPQFEKMGLLPVQGGGAGAEGDAAELQPGSPVAIPFVDGDISVAGIGTVTERVGDQVIAFGHPIMEMGRIALPLATAEVNAVIPSTAFSFKMGSVGKTVGTLMIDRTEGIYGRVGAVPAMVPLTVSLTRDDFPGPVVHHFRIAHDRSLTPMLLNMCLFSSVFMKGNLPPEYTLSYTVSVSADDGQTITRRETTSATGMMGLWSFFDSIVGVSSNLVNNPFKNVRLTEVKAELDVKAGLRAAMIDSVRVGSVKARPGKPLKLSVRLLRYRQQAETIELDVPVPDDIPDGHYSVLVTDADGALQADRNAAPSRFEPRTYDEMLGLLRLQYPRQDIYVRMALPGTGVELQGKALPNLPASALSMLTPAGRSRNEFVNKLLRTSTKTGYQINGSQTVDIIVEKEER